MPFLETTATKKIKRLHRRIRLLAGGTSASKTISSLLYLIARAQTDTTPVLTSVVSESFPHLRRGAIRDFKNIMMEHGYWNPRLWSESTFTYTFETGSPIEFFSSDQPSKVRGPRRGRLYVNEANNVPKEAWEQLLLRTTDFAIADWNPVADFYMYEDYGLIDDPGEGLEPYATDPDVDFLILTYRDNEALAASIVHEIEKRKDNKTWYRPYGLGLRGETEGKIFKNWKVIDDIPHEAKLEVRGGDFGYAQDPTAFCDIYYYNGGYIVDELCYRTNFMDDQLANLLLNQPDPNVLAIGDSADKQKIDRLTQLGVNIMGVEKRGSGGQNFTNAAISFVQGQKISITKRSLNFIKSYRNFMWQTDKEGNILPKYDHYLSDGMMAVIYGMTAFDSSRRQEEEDTTTTGDISALWA